MKVTCKMLDAENISKYAKSIDLSVVYKHLDALVNHGPQLPTNLSCLTRQNYASTMKYVNSLAEIFEWIKVSTLSDGHKVIKITEKGIEIKNHLETFFDKENAE